MSNRKGVLAKIKALLAKTVENGCTEAEAMAALDKARQMMDAYDVTDTDLAFDGEKVTQERAERDPDNIRWQLCGGVAMFCDCRVWGETASDKIVFLGLESDAVFARWLIDTLEQFVRRQSLQFLADMGRAVGGETDLFGAPLNGRDREHKRRSFVYGCVARISQRLRDAAAERRSKAAGNGRSLVVVKNALVDDAYKALSIKLRASRSKGINADPAAYRRGVATGDRASFGRPVGGKSSGATVAIGGNR